MRLPIRLTALAAFSALSSLPIPEPKAPDFRPLEFLVGVTQALTVNSIVQSNLTYYTGHGYYSDPYKTFDTRPSDRHTLAWLTRYNRYFPDPDGTLKLGYRLLFDSFGSTSNMIEAAWAQVRADGLAALSLQPAMAYRLWRRSVLHRRHAARGVRRHHRRGDRRQDVVGRLERVVARRFLSAGSRLADFRIRQPRHPDVFRALARGQSRQDILNIGFTSR